MQEKIIIVKYEFLTGGEKMTFAQAFDLLKDGEAITYDDCNGYYQYDGYHIWYHYYDENNNLMQTIQSSFVTKSLFGNNWKVFYDCIPEPITTNMTCNVSDIIEDRDEIYIKIQLPYKKKYIKNFKKINLQLRPERVEQKEEILSDPFYDIISQNQE